jgi:UDP-3-O-[3-hydroxymyristoyl] glucosamine N-acyltransferase
VDNAVDMKFEKEKTLKEIADFLGCSFVGPEDMPVTGINEIHKVEPGDIVFVDHPKYYKKALNSKADVILIDKPVEDIPAGKAIIVSASPFDDFNKITLHFSPPKIWTSSVGDNFEIGAGSVVYPNVSIGHQVKIGKNSVVLSGAVLCDYTIIGDDVIVGPNAVIGHDAFYYKKKADGFHKMHSCGRTILQDRVEVGAMTTIDRGVTGDTIIGAGTKIDNQVHIGHDTVIGKNCLFAANVGIAGCVVIEDNVTLWGQVGVTSDITIGANAVVQAQSGVSRSLPGNATYFGSPANEARTVLREMAAVRKLPSIIENL